jgi:hypothetical protein
MATSPEYEKTSVNKFGRLANRGLLYLSSISLPLSHSLIFSLSDIIAWGYFQADPYHNQGTYEYATIHGLVNACPVLHVSFNDPEHPFPVVLPMLGCTGNFGDQDAGTFKPFPIRHRINPPIHHQKQPLNKITQIRSQHLLPRPIHPWLCLGAYLQEQ